LDKIFSAYAVREDDQGDGPEVFLNLPATTYEIMDALDVLRLDGKSRVNFMVDEFYRFSSLVHFLGKPNDLYTLNSLAQKLSELDDRHAVAFEELLEIESQILKEAPYGLPDLIDIAYSTDCCHVVEEALNDVQLGRFRADNGFVPIVEAVPDSIYGLIDFEQLGRKARVEEGGVFVERTEDHPGGYVERHSELVRAYKDLDLTLRQPDYAILLEVDLGQHTAELPLPSSLSKMDETLCAVGADSWSEVSLRFLDCKAPRLIGVEDRTESIVQINRLAQKLADLEPKVLPAYKALLDAADCKSIQEAEHLMDTLDQYTFSPQITSPTVIAQEKLAGILSEQDRELLAPHLNLYQYGQSLIQQCGSILTDYGLIERKDGQPVQAMNNQPRQGGMEMM